MKGSDVIPSVYESIIWVFYLATGAANNIADTNWLLMVELIWISSPFSAYFKDTLKGRWNSYSMYSKAK